MVRLACRVFESSVDPGGMLYAVILSPNWLHYCIYLFALSLATIWLVSLFTTKPTRAMLDGLTYGSASPEQVAETRATWNHWDVIHTVFILSIIVLVYIYFW